PVSRRRAQREGLLALRSATTRRPRRVGALLRGRAPEPLAAVMAATPIAGLSVVTEPIHFGGDIEIVRRVRPLVSVPILRKDFLRTEPDLAERLEPGPAAILLTLCLFAAEPLPRPQPPPRARGL